MLVAAMIAVGVFKQKVDDLTDFKENQLKLNHSTSERIVRLETIESIKRLKDSIPLNKDVTLNES